MGLLGGGNTGWPSGGGGGGIGPATGSSYGFGNSPGVPQPGPAYRPPSGGAMGIGQRPMGGPMGQQPGQQPFWGGVTTSTYSGPNPFANYANAGVTGSYQQINGLPPGMNNAQVMRILSGEDPFTGRPMTGGTRPTASGRPIPYMPYEGDQSTLQQWMQGNPWFQQQQGAGYGYTGFGRR